MANLKTDSPLSRRIARSFLQFLNSVEPSAGVDSEALDVAKECLAEVFKVDQSSLGNQSNCDSLVDIFSSREGIARDVGDNGRASDAPASSSQKNAEVSEAARPSDKTGEPHSPVKDELFGQFFGALEKIHYFARLPNGNDNPVQLDSATNSFHKAVEEMQIAGCETFDQNSLADTFKSQGNKAMQAKQYLKAIELYTYAIALCDDNAVYYCNRAAAYTQIHWYTEAVEDCLKSIEINPNYSKAYSRLGFVYYAQGKYRDAIDKGFMKALHLDPNNESVKENIRVAEQKLNEEQRSGPGQSSTSTNHGGSNHQHGDGTRDNAPFTSIPFNMNGIPVDLSSMFMNMTGDAQHFQNRPEVDLSSMFMNMTGNAQHFQNRPEGDDENEPGIRIGGNINLNANELPEEISGAFRSVMGMFSGAPPPPSNEDQQQHDGNGRPPAS